MVVIFSKYTIFVISSQNEPGGDGDGDDGGDGDGARKNLPSPHPTRPGKNIPVRGSPHSDIGLTMVNPI